MNQERSGGFGQDPGYQNRLLPALALVTATAFAGYGTGNRTPALVRYKNESINRLVTIPTASSFATSAAKHNHDRVYILDHFRREPLARYASYEWRKTTREVRLESR